MQGYFDFDESIWIADKFVSSYMILSLANLLLLMCHANMRA